MVAALAGYTNGLVVYYYPDRLSAYEVVSRLQAVVIVLLIAVGQYSLGVLIFLDEVARALASVRDAVV